MNVGKHEKLIYALVNRTNPHAQRVNDTFIPFVINPNSKSLEEFKQATENLIEKFENELKWYYSNKKELRSNEINDLEEFQYLPKMKETLQTQTEVLKVLNDKHKTAKDTVAALKKDNLIQFPTPDE